MRPDHHSTFMEIAHVLARRSTCSRRAVGCVLVNDHNHIIGTGYNGSPVGAPHCIANPCSGARSGHGSGLDLCDAIHAEQNALLQCRDVQEIATIYTTSFPCAHCFKMIANTSCCEIYFAEEYPSARGTVLALNQQLTTPMEFYHFAAGPVPQASRVGATPRS